MKKILFCAAALAALSGCAADPAVTAADDISAREYPTGSNIPRKGRASGPDGVSTYDREALERARAEQVQAPRPGLGAGGR